MVTLKDIAEEANVSVMTVSRVINNVNGRVSEATRDRILKIIEARGYVPNSTARSLSSKSSKLIAIIRGGGGNITKYPYNSEMVGSVCEYIQASDYSTLLYQVTDYRDVTRQLRSWNVEGAIFLGMFDSDMRKIQENNRIPLVFTDSYSDVRQITNVGIDDHKGGMLAAKFLLGKGHRHIAFLGNSSSESPVIRHRLYGFRATLGGAGVELPDDHILPDLVPPEDLQRLFANSDGHMAFFATSDFTAIQLIHDLNTLGLKVPDDCSVIGFDNLPISELSFPALTTISQDISRKAQIACDILFKHIAKPETPSQNIVLDVELIERKSVRDLTKLED